MPADTDATVRVTRILQVPIERAFRAFVENIDDWWPRSYSLLHGERADLVIEPRQGGRWFERSADGSVCEWGQVIAWEPPDRVVLSWQIGVGFVSEPDPERASRVELRFETRGPERTCLRLTHTAFERHGKGWETMRDGVAGDGGWPAILDALAGTATTIASGDPRAAADAAVDGLGRVTEPGTIRFERLLPGPVERVWEYLTDSRKRGRWFSSGDMELRPGGRVEMRFRHADLSEVEDPTPEKWREYEGETVMYGRITRCQPPRLLSYTWGERSGDDSEVTFELTPRGDSVLLVLTHRRLGGDRETLLSVGAGWHAHLAILSDELTGLARRPFWSTHLDVEKAYSRIP